MRATKVPAEVFVWQKRCHVTVETAKAEQLRHFLRDHHIGSAPPIRLLGDYVTFELDVGTQEGEVMQGVARWNERAYGCPQEAESLGVGQA